MLQLVCVEHGCWKDMTRQGKSGAAIFHHGHRSKEYQSEQEEKYETEAPEKQR